MIRSAHIQRYRGIRDLAVDGLGRVNLVIGRNDCGKTALLEALQLADDPRSGIGYLIFAQGRRFARVARRQDDLEQFWCPLFFDLDARAGLSLSFTRRDGSQATFAMKQGNLDEVVYEAGDRQGMDDGEDSSFVPWILDVEISLSAQPTIQQRVISTPKGLRHPATSEGSPWIAGHPQISDVDIRAVSTLKQRGDDGILVSLLREVDSRLSGIELLAPRGDRAELFVRLDNGTPMLPVAMMGDGFQRCLEIGAIAATDRWPALFIDEIDAGMHHLALEPLWRWIAAITSQRDLQVFATTHSEECIHAAAAAFGQLKDDGLRVIRLDRIDGGTRATVYDRGLVEVAERTGTEIRG